MKKLAAFMAAVLVLTTVFFSSNVFADTSYPIQEKVLVVLVQFAETEASLESLETYTNNYTDIIDGSRTRIYNGNINKDDAYYNSLFFGTGIDTQTGEMKNTVKNYYREVSNGRVDLVPAEETSGAANDGIVRITLPEPFPDPQNSYITSGTAAGILKDAVSSSITQSVFEKLDELNCVDFSSFDAVTPDKLHIVFVLASGNSDTKPYTRAFNEGPKTFEINGESYSNARVSIVNSKQIYEFGTICHEMAHDMGAIDLYDKPNSNIGFFSLMCHGCNFSKPTHLDPWHEIKLGFVEPTVINQSGIYQVNAVNPNNPGEYNVLKIPVPSLTYNKSEYFLIENRQFTGFDSVLAPYYSSAGITIWHIDDTYTDNIGTPLTFSLELSGTYANDSLDWLYRNDGTGSNYILSPTSSPGTSNTSEGKPTGIKVIVNSPSSNSMYVTIQIMQTPAHFKAVANGRDTELTWDPVPNATEYEISVDNGAFSSVGSNTSYIATGFGKHSYQVRAKNSTLTSLETRELDTVNVLYGDVNGDGQVDTNDYQMLYDGLLGVNPYFITLIKGAQKLAADVDGNGSVNVLDLARLQAYLNNPSNKFSVGDTELITYGDINHDGFVTSDDLVMLNNDNTVDTYWDNANTKITDRVLRVAADVLVDGIIDLADKNQLENYLKYDYQLEVMKDN